MAQRVVANAKAPSFKRFVGLAMDRVTSKLKEGFKMNMEVPLEKPLHRFASASDMELMLTFSDKAVGGSSTCELVLTDENTAKFHGNLSLSAPVHVKKTGYCGFRSKEIFLTHNLGGYDGLRLRVKGDGRNYSLNLQTDSFQREQVFQMLFATVPGLWESIDIPFEHMSMTWRGKVQESTYRPNVNKVRTIGISLSDNVDGPFELDIESITAYRETEEMIVARKHPSQREAEEQQRAQEEEESGAAPAAGMYRS